MNRDERTEAAVAALRARLYDDSGKLISVTCPACGHPVSDLVQHAETCWQLRKSVASETQTEMKALDDTAEMDREK